MPDLEKRRAAKERAKRRREELKHRPPRKCEDCGATIATSDLHGYDPVRCGSCLKARNSAARHAAGFRDDGRAA